MPMDFEENIRYIIGDPDKCKIVGLNKLWVPVRQGNLIDEDYGVYQWFDDRASSNQSIIQSPNWKQSEPNGLQIEQCVDAFGDSKYWNDESCSSKRCSVCRMPVVQTYYLRGPRIFDQVYSLLFNMQRTNSKIVFEGEGTSVIIWYPDEGQTQIKNYKMNYSVTFHKNPFGILQNENSPSRKTWIFTKVCSIYTIYLNNCTLDLTSIQNSATPKNSSHAGMVFVFHFGNDAMK